MTRKILKAVCIVALLCASIAWRLLSLRFSALLLFGLLLFALMSFPLHRRWYLVAGVWGLFLIAPLLPIDIAFDRTSGLGPRIMPITYGLLSAKGEALAEQRLIFWGGCIASPHSAHWVLVL